MMTTRSWDELIVYIYVCMDVLVFCVCVFVKMFDILYTSYICIYIKTKNKGKYTALLAILIVGSFIIPMAQYFWYVRDDDSTDKFFGQEQQQVEEPPPKKKGWF